MHARITLLAPINDAVFQEFAKQHLAVVRDGVGDVIVVISSEGGKNAAGRQFYSLLKSSPLNVSTVAMGRVESAAISVLCGGSRRIGLPGTAYLLHDLDWNLNGTFTRLQIAEKHRIIESDFARNVEIVAETTGKTGDEITGLMSVGTTLVNATAAALGLITEVAAKMPTADFEILITQNGQSPVLVQDSRHKNQPSAPGAPVPQKK